MDLTSGLMDIQLIPQYPVIKESVILSVIGTTGRIRYFAWYKGPNTRAEYQFLKYTSAATSPLLPGPVYVSRARPFPNGSLLITDLHMIDTGNYIIRVQTEKSEENTSVSLTVYQHLRKLRVTASTSHPTENDTFTLTCNTRNAERILWSRDSVSLPSGSILRANNRTVTFSRVTRGDSGEYRCEIENSASKSISDPYTVTVYYGPDNVQITGELLVHVGSYISLSCSADSYPPPNYQWIFKDSDLNIKQNTLLLYNAYDESQGMYTCAVTNPATRRNATASVYVIVALGVRGSPDELSVTQIAGIIFGTVLGTVLIVSVTFLLYKRCVLPVREEQRETSNEKQESPSEYYNVQAPTVFNPASQENTYVGLQYKTQDTYSDLQRGYGFTA
ncbi:carcinoembryonic antigen-related cell adhesion molecule 8-like [Pseudophryne corroboree]|uniref:carcinoembryonic antigen-related cell adhesion molecule 8-like n=1 Tax=Pseudophryne corroboree TaxID=495146 RepID=UPI0030812CB1